VYTVWFVQPVQAEVVAEAWAELPESQVPLEAVTT